MTDKAQGDDSATAALFAGPSEMCARCRALDWAATPLGPVVGWPVALRTVVRLTLDAAFPMCVFAGPELVLVYNDGYRALLGVGKDPTALGRPAREVWGEVWDQAAPEFAQVLAGGPPLRYEDQRFVIERGGPGAAPEETFWTYALSPVHGEDGAVVAVHNVAAETTARVQTEAALRASEGRYRALATASADVLYRMSPDWTEMRQLDGRGFLSDTPASGALVSGAPVPGDDWLTRYIHPDDQVRVTAAIREAVRTRSPFALEHRVIRADGTLGWTASRAVPVLDSAGGIVEWIGTASDVTARRAADEARRASEARARALITHLPASAAFVVDHDLRYVMAGGEALRATGLDPGDLVGRTLDEALGPARAAAHAPLYRRALGGESFAVEHEQDGRAYLTRGVPLRDESGRVEAALAVSVDITERKRTEAALREGEARFRAVVDLVPDLLWQSEPDGSTSWYNARWGEYTGQGHAAAEGWGWAAAVHPEDRERSAVNYARAVARGEPLMQEHRIRRHDGAYRWFIVRAEPRRDPEGHIVGWFGAATDIHEQRLALEEVERRVAARTAERDALRRQLAEAEEGERRRLARELHDEAGQHLTAVGLGLRALTDVVRPGSEVARRAQALGALVDTLGRELHDLAVRLRPRALDDYGLESALVAYGDAWTRRSGIAAEVHAPAIGRRLTPAVESAVYRIVQEALTNVARHSGATRASVLVERRDGHLWVAVEDDGRGFDADAPRGGGGVPGGLGLLGIRERAALLDGTVEIESSPGAGTTVFVRIPVRAAGHDACAGVPHEIMPNEMMPHGPGGVR